MRGTKTIFTVIFLLVFLNRAAHAQIHVINEVGVLAGPAAFFTDYGERWNIKSNLDNGGFGVGLVHYMRFSYKRDCSCFRRTNYFGDHFRIRTELDYLRSDLEHVGPATKGDGENAKKLRAMHGFTETLEGGLHLEYYPFSLNRFNDFGYWISPYIALGIHYVNYSPQAYSDLGPLDSPGVLYPSFENGVNLDSGHTTAIAGSMGFRFKINVRHDIMLEGRWHYYSTDYIDGLDVQGVQNMYNDIIFWFNLGYIYHINF